MAPNKADPDGETSIFRFRCKFTPILCTSRPALTRHEERALACLPGLPGSAAVDGRGFGADCVPLLLPVPEIITSFYREHPDGGVFSYRLTRRKSVVNISDGAALLVDGFNVKLTRLYGRLISRHVRGWSSERGIIFGGNYFKCLSKFPKMERGRFGAQLWGISGRAGRVQEVDLGTQSR